MLPWALTASPSGPLPTTRCDGNLCRVERDGVNDLDERDDPFELS